MKFKNLESYLRYDFSAGTETFREMLLQRCLPLVCQDDGGICYEITDDDLEFLSAAGNAYVERPQQTTENDI